jgi:hypothetical protein
VWTLDQAFVFIVTLKARKIDHFSCCKPVNKNYLFPQSLTFDANHPERVSVPEMLYSVYLVAIRSHIDGYFAHRSLEELSQLHQKLLQIIPSLADCASFTRFKDRLRATVSACLRPVLRHPDLPELLWRFTSKGMKKWTADPATRHRRKRN